MGKEIYFKATKGGKLAALASANSDKMAKEAVADLEAAGCTVTVISEFEFNRVMAGAIEDGAELKAHARVERRVEWDGKHVDVAPGVH